MSGIRKIVPPTPHRKRVPFFDWLKKKLLLVERDKPPGVPGSKGECVYIEHIRFPDTQSSRSPDLPKIPGGVYHKLSDNYYYERDARRQVEPPMALVKDGQIVSTGIEAKNLSDHMKSSIPSPVGPAVCMGPTENFGLGKLATPGVGFAWMRKVESELDTQRDDPNMHLLEKYDGYQKP